MRKIKMLFLLMLLCVSQVGCYSVSRVYAPIDERAEVERQVDHYLDAQGVFE